MNWEMIFKLSKVNGALYLGDALPAQNWKWPKNTWLQERLRDPERRAPFGPTKPGKRLYRTDGLTLPCFGNP